MSRDNVGSIRDCFGCGVCALACKKRIINIVLNRDGFYEPSISNLSECSHCGLCIRVCSFSHKNISSSHQELASYAGWSNDLSTRLLCTSGGVSYEIARTMINEGYKICGVRYNHELARAEHYIVEDIANLNQIKGSKYLQSYTNSGFCSFNKTDKYVVFGTPCQIDSLRRWIQLNKLDSQYVLIDFFCHSVPSMYSWKKYISYLEEKIGKIRYASWRNKLTPEYVESDSNIPSAPIVDWHESYNMIIRGTDGVYQKKGADGDIFLNLFLSDACNNPACRKDCKYKLNHSSADIRLGDLWSKDYLENKEGINSIIVFSSVGQAIIEKINCSISDISLASAYEGQLKKNANSHIFRSLIIHMLKSKGITMPVIQAVLRFGNIPRNCVWHLKSLFESVSSKN